MARRPLDLNLWRWVASLVAVSASLVAAFAPNHRASAAMVSAVAGAALAWIAHATHARNRFLKAEVHELGMQVLSLGGSIDELGGDLRENHPSLHVAAAIYGQHELATMGYRDLVNRLQADGHIWGDE